jgi:hypothetical protein
MRILAIPDALHNAIDIRAVLTFNVEACELHVLEQRRASVTVPRLLMLGQFVQYGATVAFLVDGSRAQIANQDFVALLVIIAKTHIALNVVIVQVLRNNNVFVWLGGVDHFLVGCGRLGQYRFRFLLHERLRHILR